MIYTHGKKGFTMVELVIVIAIMGVVFTAISAFLINNLKTFNRAENQIDAQYNAQVAMNQIVDNIMESQCIVSINSNTGSYLGGVLDVSDIIFKIKDDEYIKYEYNGEKNELSRGKGTSQGSIDTDLYASNVERFYVELIIDSGDTAYKESKGIIIHIETLIKDSNIKLTNQVHFRNATN